MHSLALFGGQPIRKKPFPAWPPVTTPLKEALLSTLESGVWGVGSQVITDFETAFAQFQGARFCISTSSGTAALWVTLKAAGVAAGDEVIIPPYTFIATATAVLMANAVPVFVDVDPDTFNLNPALIEGAITDRTRVIMPVHMGGNPAQMDQILKVARRHNLQVIEDAAQAHGAEWDHRRVGALGLGGIFSFQSSKNMAAGEGGAIVSNDETFIGNCFSYYNCGRVREGAWYEHRVAGGNFRLNAFAASILRAQLDTISETMALRDANRQRLDEVLGQIKGLTPVKTYAQTTRSANHIYLLKYQSQAFHGLSREVFFKAMQAEGIYTYAGYRPLYRESLFTDEIGEYPWLESQRYARLQLPVTERLCNQEAVWLKQTYLLGTERDTQDIIDAFEKVTTAMRKSPALFREV